MADKPKILLVTSKWSVEDSDGGMSTAADICDTISAYCHLDVLVPSAFLNYRREGVESIIGYDIPEELRLGYNGAGKFQTRVLVSRYLTEALYPLIDSYDRIIVLHIFHLLDLFGYMTESQTNKFVLFPMLLTPSYLMSNEVVPASYTMLERNVLQKVRTIVSPSLCEKEQITGYFSIPESKVVCIPRYVGDVFDACRHTLSSSTKCDICYVASIKKQKQNRLAVEVLGCLRSWGIDARLHLVGTVHDEAVYNDMVNYIQKNNLEDAVTFHGVVSQKEINRLYRDVTFGISVSLCETFGRSVMEGLASGLPTIVMKGVACLETDTSTDKGIMRVSSVTEMAKAIVRCLGDEELYEKLSLSAIAFGQKYRRACVQPFLQAELLG